MRVLVIYSHAVPESYCAALRDLSVATLKEAGHEVRLVDLYAEGFDPVMSADERRNYNERPTDDPRLKPHFENLAWAEALLFVYPTWWYGLPAMLKGWLDRVWCLGVAFDLVPDGPIRPLMGHIRKLGVVTTCGAPSLMSFMIGQPGRKTLLRGIRVLCAKGCRTFYLAHYRMDDSTPASREAFSAKVRAKLKAF